MGYHAHHAIIVTGFDKERMEKARAAVAEIVPETTPLTPEATNGFCSFLVPPDGTVKAETIRRWIEEPRDLRRQALHHLHDRFDALIAEAEAERAKMEEGGQ